MEKTLEELYRRLQSARENMATMTLDKTVMMSTQTIAPTSEERKLITAPPTKAKEPTLPPKSHTVPTMMGISQELRREICEHVSAMIHFQRLSIR